MINMKKIVYITITLLLSVILVSCDKDFKVSFDTDGGESINSVYIEPNKEIGQLPTPTKDGYVFLYWSLNDEKVDENYVVQKNITLKAIWKEEENYKNPVWEPVLADPSVIRHEGVYYAFGTQDDGVWGDDFGVKYGPILSSTNLIDWKYEGSVFEPYNRPGGDWASLNAGIWAPDIVKIKDKFVLYYSLSTWGDPNPGIGVAIADHPVGPWEDKGKLFTSEEIGVNNSIDATVFLDEDENVYIIWGSFRGLYGIELTKDGLSVKGGVEYANENKVHIAGLDTSTPWNGDTYEAPYVIKKDGYYYMFVSSGTCCDGHNSTYNVRVARSKNPLGPYVGKDGRDMLSTNRGTLVLEKNEIFVGTGHNGIAVDDNGDYWIVYHAFDTREPSHVGNTNRRSMLIDLLLWDEEGFPYVEGKSPSINSDKVPFINEEE